MPSASSLHPLRPWLIAVALCAAPAIATTLPTTGATQPATRAALLPPATTRAAAVTMPANRYVLAEGVSSPQSGERRMVWVASIEPDPVSREDLTVVRRRDLSAGSADWEHHEPIRARAAALTHVSGKLVVLLRTGQFWFYSDTYTPGLDLPARTRILALAGDRGRLWAIGEGDVSLLGSPAIGPRTQPPTQPATVSSPSTTQRATPAPTIGPATAPGFQKPGLVFWQLGQRSWLPRYAWPEDVPRPSGSAISMIVINEEPVVAYVGADGALEVLRVGHRDHFRHVIRLDQDVRDFRLLNIGSTSVLWLFTGQGAGLLLDLSSIDAGPRPIAYDGPPLSPGRIDIAVAGDHVRLLGTSPDGHLFEQQYSRFTLQPAGSAQPIAPRRPGAGESGMNWFYIVAMGIMGALIASAMRKQRADASQLVLPGGYEIAPLPLRLGAAAIDAIPILVGGAVVLTRLSQFDYATILLEDAVTRTWVLVTSGVYLLHTMLSELLTQRTLGKLICGLRVVDPDGNAPRPQSLFFRNILRIMDLPVVVWMGLALDLLIMFYSPLRQRLGDLAAGTLVVRKTDRPPTPRPQPDEEPADDPYDEDGR